MLQGTSHFHRATSVRKSFHHTHHLRFRAKFGTEIVQVIDQRIQVDFQRCFMGNKFKFSRNIFKMKFTRTFEQYNFVVKFVNQWRFQKTFGIVEK